MTPRSDNYDDTRMRLHDRWNGYARPEHLNTNQRSVLAAGAVENMESPVRIGAGHLQRAGRMPCGATEAPERSRTQPSPPSTSGGADAPMTCVNTLREQGTRQLHRDDASAAALTPSIFIRLWQRWVMR